MTSTREHRNEGMIQDAVASIGTTITVCEYLYSVLASVLPDDFPGAEVREALGELREAHDKLSGVIGV